MFLTHSSALFFCRSSTPLCNTLATPFATPFTGPEGARDYNLYIPKSYNATAQVPLVLHWHGWSDSCDDFGGHCRDSHCGFFEESEARGFIFAAVCGWGEPASFNAGTCCPPANTFALDDV